MHSERENGSDTARTNRAGGESTPTAVVRTVGGELEAEAIRTALESAGIPVRIKMESLAKIIAVTVDGLGKVEVLVPPDCLEEAESILSNDVDQDELVEQALSAVDGAAAEPPKSDGDEPETT